VASLRHGSLTSSRRWDFFWAVRPRRAVPSRGRIRFTERDFKIEGGMHPAHARKFLEERIEESFNGPAPIISKALDGIGSGCFDGLSICEENLPNGKIRAGCSCSIAGGAAKFDGRPPPLGSFSLKYEVFPFDFQGKVESLHDRAAAAPSARRKATADASGSRNPGLTAGGKTTPSACDPGLSTSSSTLRRR